jgi:hypothetical protein
MIRAFLLGLLLAASPPAVAADLVAAPEDLVIFEPPPPVPDGFTTVPGLHADVHGHPEYEPLLLEISRQAAEALPRLAEELGVPIGGRVQIYVAATDEEFRALQPGRPPEWADATAWPESGTVFLRSNRARGSGQRPLAQVLDHELVHVLVGRAFMPHEPPRWLHEGLARYVAGEYDPAAVDILAKGMATGGLYSVEELQLAFPRHAQGAQLAYAQSSDFIAWLVAEHGEEALRTTIRELAAGRTIDAALYTATGQNLHELDAAWRSRFSKPGAPLWAAGLGDLAWWGTGILALGAAVLARRRYKMRMERYAELERAREASLAGWWIHPIPPDQVH